MKKRFLLLGFFVLGISTLKAQSTVVGNGWAAPRYLGFDGTNGANPLFFRTNALNRMKVNGNVNYTVNGYAGIRNGYMLLGADGTSITDGQNIYTQKGAFSLLHLNGATTSNGYQEFGYRPWMQTGITLTGNRDLSYFGLRQLGSLEDITETTITWSDNNDASTPGPDDMVFRFTSAGGSTSYLTDFSNATDVDGLHVSRFTSKGLMGLGNTFGVYGGSPSVQYNDPKSLLHMSYQFRTGAVNQPFGFMQISYRRQNGSATDIIGQGETADDGLRFGIDNTVYTTDGIQHLNGYLRWQENSPFIFQTDWNNPAGGTNGGERMRISSTNSPGVPPTLMNMINTTRVSINYLGTAPITQPRSLLHLGVNNGTTAVANWMDFGMLTSNAQDATFIGLTPTNYSDPNQSVIGYGGTDLVFIESGDAEVVRIVQANNYVGIGNYSPTGPNTAGADVIDAKLDIDGDLRIRTVTQDNSLTQVLVIDPTDHNRVHWADLTIPPSSGNGFTDCADNSGAADLLADSKVNLNDYNLYFENGSSSTATNKVGVGFSCNDALPGKLNSQSFGGANNWAVWGYAQDGTTNIGGNFRAYGGSNAWGVYGSADNGSSDTKAGYFQGDVFIGGAISYPSDSTLKENVQVLENANNLLEQLNPVTFDFKVNDFPQMHLNANNQMGLIAQEVELVLPSIVSQTISPAEYDSLGNQIHNEFAFKTVDYSKLIPLLIAGYQEQNVVIDSLTNTNDSLQSQITDLNNRLTDLENCLSGILPFLCQLNNTAIEQNETEVQEQIRSIIDVQLSNKNSIVLNQNVPNPFAESTVITYSVPASVQRAQIHFYDMNGMLINSVDISERGAGQINVYGNDLSSGIYTYSLVADGKVVSTKKMMKN